MNLNVTKIVNHFLNHETLDASDYSGSVAELGEHAASITWGNCLTFAAHHLDLLPTESEQQEVRDHFKEYGAWEEEEIAAWDQVPLVAMIIQEVAAEIRRLSDLIDLEEFTEDELLAATENEGGRLWGTPGGPTIDRSWDFYVGV